MKKPSSLLLNKNKLRRYTDLPSVIDMLAHKRIALTNFAGWVDVNDSFGLGLYQEHMRYSFVGAMCLTGGAETFHHWHIFANGPSGICVVFRKSIFEQMIEAAPNCTLKPVEYVLLNKVNALDATDIERLPFLKREGFRAENEYRVIGFEPTGEREVIYITLLPDAIERIVISPFLKPALHQGIEAMLQSVAGDPDLIVQPSTLINSQRWQEAIRRFVKRHGVIYGDPIPFTPKEKRLISKVAAKPKLRKR